MTDILIQLGAALILTSALILIARSRGYTRGYQHGLADGRGETQQLKYAEGYSQGVYEGRLKERLEWETRAYKSTRDSQAVFEDGYQAALAEMRGETYRVMLGEAETKLSA